MILERKMINENWAHVIFFLLQSFPWVIREWVGKWFAWIWSPNPNLSQNLNFMPNSPTQTLNYLPSFVKLVWEQNLFPSTCFFYLSSYFLLDLKIKKNKKSLEKGQWKKKKKGKIKIQKKKKEKQTNLRKRREKGGKKKKISNLHLAHPQAATFFKPNNSQTSSPPLWSSHPANNTRTITSPLLHHHWSHPWSSPTSSTNAAQTDCHSTSSATRHLHPSISTAISSASKFPSPQQATTSKPRFPQ